VTVAPGVREDLGVPTTNTSGVEIYFEDHGGGGPALLLVNGFTSQLVKWEFEFIERLGGEGFRVIVFDNRDVGLSAKTPGPLPRFTRGENGALHLAGPPPYTLADMAADGIAVLDALEIDRAHVVGMSMGGMIVQHMAFGFPERVLTMTSIMSTTGAPNVGRSEPEALSALLAVAPTERDGYIEHSVASARVYSGPLFDEERARRRAARAYDRAFNPAGGAFQMAAIQADGDRTARLADVRCPTLVIHGRADTLITVSGGEATAAAIPGAELLVLDDMGHDIPLPLLDEIVPAIARLARRASAERR
jgi:pimeloyl-ACP methyl ester carboxylesterase